MGGEHAFYLFGIDVFTATGDDVKASCLSCIGVSISTTPWTGCVGVGLRRWVLVTVKRIWPNSLVAMAYCPPAWAKQSCRNCPALLKASRAQRAEQTIDVIGGA